VSGIGSTVDQWGDEPLSTGVKCRPDVLAGDRGEPDEPTSPAHFDRLHLTAQGRARVWSVLDVDDHEVEPQPCGDFEDYLVPGLAEERVLPRWCRGSHVRGSRWDAHDLGLSDSVVSSRVAVTRV